MEMVPDPVLHGLDIFDHVGSFEERCLNAASAEYTIYHPNYLFIILNFGITSCFEKVETGVDFQQ